MKHQLIEVEEDGTFVVFQCSECLAEVRVAMEGFGEPFATEVGLSWIPSCDLNDYMDPCAGVPA